MKISINQLLNRFPSDIKIRGQEFYDNRDYCNEVLIKNLFECYIRGITNVYHVTIHLEDNMITDMSCECPYFNGGHLCKHLYAAVLLLRDKLKQSTPSSGKEVLAERKKILTDYKNLIADYDLEKQTLKNFLHPFIERQDMSTLLSLCRLTKFKNHVLFFLDILYDSKLKETFFSSVTDDDLQGSSIKYLIEFMMDHDDLKLLMNLNTLRAALDSNIGQSSYFYHMFRESMILDRKEYVKVFSNSLQFISYDSDYRLFQYLKEKEKPENYLSYFENRFQIGRIYKYEYAFLSPYLTEQQKKDFLSIVKRNNDRYYHYYRKKELDDYHTSSYIEESEIKIAEGIPSADIESMNLTDFGAFRNTVFKDYKGKAIKRFRVVINSLLRKKNVSGYELFSTCLIFKDCLEDNEDLRVPFMKFINCVSQWYGMGPDCHGYYFELLKKTKSLSQNQRYVDFEEGATEYDAMDIVKTEVGD